MRTHRLNRLFDLLSSNGFDAAAINPGPTLTYLTGLHFHLMERPVVLLAAPGKTPVLVLPELEQLKLQQSAIPAQGFTFGENPAVWTDVFATAARSLGLDAARIAIEPTRMRYLELNLLQSALPHAHFAAGDAVFSGLRMQKDASEIESMRKAVRIAQTALLATLPHVHPGVTEREIAAELTVQLLRAGSDSELPFAPIVSGGPNSANPHASPSDRPLQIGDLLVIDWGAACEDYVSDLTRTFAIGPIDDEQARIHTLVQQSNAAGRAAGQPGIPAGDVDRAARRVIEAAGYGPYFTHRTGHGLGMEGHEPPYMFAENTLLLAEGMTYTVEPGIYLPGRGGVRIEDNIAVTATGCETLSDLPRELITLE